MKALASVVLVLAICLATVIPSSAAGDKTLENVRGTVSLDQGPGTPSQPVAVNASVAISDSQYAVTGGAVGNLPSQGAIALPDSTRILVGQNTRVQMKQFDMQPNLTTANFVVLSGKIRFKVEHPGGAKANYTFQTSTGQIAVRGTEGDIWTPQLGALQVNVYQVTDPALPVEVTLNNGKVYKLSAGQTLTVGILGAAIAAGTAGAASSSSSSSASVTSTSQSSMSNFTEFGAVSNGAVVAGAAAAAAAASAGGIPAVAAIAAGVAAIGGVVIGTTGHPGTEPSSAPTSAPGSVVVNPTSLSFTPGTGPLTFHASQTNFTGTFHAAIDQGSIASVNATSTTGDFTVTPKTNGSTSITITGGSGETAPVGVAVQATTITVPGSLPAFSSLNQAQNFTAQEAYYNGGFSAKSSDATIAKVTSPGSSSSGGGNFTVTSVGNGSTTITVSDSLGHSAPVGVTVNGPAPTPTPTSIPICIGMPVSGGRGQGARHRMEPAMAVAPGRPNPAATATCPPTPMAGPPIAKPIDPPVVRAPQPHPIGPQPPTILPPHVPGMPTPPPMPGGPP
ncbi:MAG TPA: FecR domain-containing protein [Candidatus Baltobacteraceae bacterium]|nr:FecR domain-containing protein [Candidatus Baltobacteraceae bacterium]